MSAYTVKQFSDLARVSVRTLHHYDEIGLLKPAYVGDNGYRYYERPQWLRLQQILLYREMGLSLEDIGAVLDRRDFDVAAALKAHRARLEAELERFKGLIGVIDATLQGLGSDALSPETLYSWPSAERQAEYEAWLIERYGADMQTQIDASRQHTGALGEAGQAAAMAPLQGLESDLVDAFRHGLRPQSPLLDPLIQAHNQWVARMWNRPCPPPAYAGLADMYLSHPDFVARYEALSPGFTDFLTAAMKAWVARQG